jgi:CO dehydrogenase/acetyl-CoA synthase beta subunit
MITTGDRWAEAGAFAPLIRHVSVYEHREDNNNCQCDDELCVFLSCGMCDGARLHHLCNVSRFRSAS